MVENRKHELPIPPNAATNDKARELLRVWASNGKQHVTLAAGLWEDPASWGIMLVDLAKHLANAYNKNRGDDRNIVLTRIKEAFEAEWKNATDQPSGDLLK